MAADTLPVVLPGGAVRDLLTYLGRADAAVDHEARCDVLLFMAGYLRESLARHALDGDVRGESTGVDWAVRWLDQAADRDAGIDRNVTISDPTGESYARRVHAQHPRVTELVQRTNGPWLPVVTS